MRESVCILCLRRFNKGETAGLGENEPLLDLDTSDVVVVPDNVNVGTDLMMPPPPPEDASLTRKTLEPGPDLYSRFLVFTGRFLKIPESEMFQQQANERKSSTGENIQAFCEHCEVLARHVCDLYAELEVVKLHILKRLDELEKVTRLSMTCVSWKLTSGLTKSAAKQLNIKSVLQFNLYRKSLTAKCKQKTGCNTPKVLVPRGLFPEYWNFKYAATLNTLIRLIFIFALGSMVVPVKEVKGVLETHEPRHKRRPGPRKRRKIAATVPGSEIISTVNNFTQPTVKVELGKDVEVKHEFGEWHEVNKTKEIEITVYPDVGVVDGGIIDSDNEGEVDDNDSDWSGGAISHAGSVGSAASVVNYNSEQEDVVPQKRRRLRRRTCQGYSIKQESDRGEKSEEKGPADEDIELGSGKTSTQESKPSFLEYVCKICDDKFKTSQLHYDHAIKFHREMLPPKTRNYRTQFLKYRKIVCRSCNIEFSSKPEFKLHEEELHEEELHSITIQTNLKLKPKIGRPRKFSTQTPESEGSHVCPTCDKKFVRACALSAHLVFAHDPHKEYKCTLCDRKFETAQRHANHAIKFHSDTLKPKSVNFATKLKKCRIISCRSCDIEFNSLFEYGRHRKMRHDTSYFHCRFCPKKFKGEPSYREHCFRHEKKKKINHIFHCEFCEKTFCTEDTLADHVVLMHEEKFVCSICDATFPTYRSLRNHLKTHETDHKNFWCHFCHHGYTNEQYWQLHRKFLHVGLNKLVCDQKRCAEEFVGVDDLKEHLKGHIKEMRSIEDANEPEHLNNDLKIVLKNEDSTDDNYSVYSCKTCGWSFLKEYSLVLHELVHVPYEKNIGFRCPQQKCSEILGGRSLLVRHYNKNHGAKTSPYHCHECKAKFTDISIYKVHLRRHQERKSGKSVTCDICNEAFLDTLAFNWHRRNHDNPNVNKNQPCAQEQPVKTKKTRKRRKVNDFDSRRSNRKRYRKPSEEIGISEEDKKIQCNFCSMKFHRQQAHQLHIQHYHAKHHRFVCDAEWCYADFDNVLDLNEHLKKTHLRCEGDDDDDEKSENETERYIVGPNVESAEGSSTEPDLSRKLAHKVASIVYCKICDWGFVNPYYLQLHELCHITIPRKRVSCPYCDKNVVSHLALAAHYNAKHGKNIHLKLIKCDECPSKMFPGFVGLVQHKKIAHKKDKGKPPVKVNPVKKETQGSKKTFTCSEEGCGEKFLENYKLSHHLKVVHGQGERYPCPICGVTFLYESHTTSHVEHVHGPRKFECDICQKRFKRMYHLKKHIRRHDDTPKYICTECGKPYKEEMGLIWHMASIHTPEHLKRFSCPHCPYKTHRRILLNSHLKTCMRNKGIAQ